MRTPLDAVRYIQNRSSGWMGLEVARAASILGARVHVLLGPVEAEVARAFADFEVTRYETPDDYGAALRALFPQCTVFMSLAAVLDFEAIAFAGKIAREELGDTLPLRLRTVPDFAAWAGAHKARHQKVIAFCAEALPLPELLERARQKCAKKNADAIVANPVTAGLGPEALRNELWVLQGDQVTHLGPAAKADLGRPLLLTLFGTP